jgi:hypothetical protein
MEGQVYAATRMRQACPVTRRIRTIAVVSWLGGAASILPFATQWFDLSARASNLLLFAAIVSTFVFSLLIGRWQELRDGLARLAGPPEKPAHALLVVAAVGGCTLTAMLAATAIIGSL